MTHRQALENEYFALYTATLNVGSRWYAEDVAHARKVAAAKSDDELLLAINNQKALNNISDKTIRTHCQFDGLGL